MNARYDWIRYCYLTNRPPAFAAAGFSSDPSGRAFSYVKETLVSTREISDVPCFVLFGEPGMGKSDVFESDYEAQHRELEACSQVTVEFRRCTDLGGEASILQFFSSGLVSDWKTGSKELVLFLDGLDEGMLLAESWPSVLITQLQSLPLERLKLRISCRPAVWPDSLSAQLAQLFKLEKLPEYSLAPLSEEHVRLAAQSAGIDSSKFLIEVNRKAAIHMLQIPSTVQARTQLVIATI